MHSLGSQYLQESGSLQRKPPIDERCSAFDEENLKAEQELASSTRGFQLPRTLIGSFALQFRMASFGGTTKQHLVRLFSGSALH